MADPLAVGRCARFAGTAAPADREIADDAVGDGGRGDARPALEAARARRASGRRSRSWASPARPRAWLRTCGLIRFRTAPVAPVSAAPAVPAPTASAPVTTTAARRRPRRSRAACACRSATRHRELTATVDGRPASLPLVLPAGPAAHSVVFHAPGYGDRNIVVDGSADRTLTLGMARLPAAESPAPERPAPDRPSRADVGRLGSIAPPPPRRAHGRSAARARRRRAEALSEGPRASARDRKLKRQEQPGRRAGSDRRADPTQTVPPLASWRPGDFTRNAPTATRRRGTKPTCTDDELASGSPGPRTSRITPVTSAAAPTP